MDQFDRLDAFLDRAGVDGYLVDAPATDSDQCYLSGYDASDPYVTLYTPDRLAIMIKSLEYPRAKRESRADAVRRPSDFGYSAYGTPADHRDAVAAFLAEFDVGAVAVPLRFPAGHADGLRERGIEVTPEDEGVVTRVRAIKTDDEIDYIREAQRATEAAMRRAEDLIANAAVRDGVLQHEGEPLTAERVKRVLQRNLLDRGYDLGEPIVAPGEQAADPHERGSGPLRADEPILIDLAPRDEDSKYHADMTRTFVRGEPSDEFRERYEVTREALDAALAALQPGVTGAEVHDAVCDVYEEAGYATLRSDPDTETGFIHATGHGVGLDGHELPSVGPGGAALEPGHAVTIEPGLYAPTVGGVRIEDLAVVTEDGHENLTEYPIELEVGE
ncbi:MAG: Xaa-Pro aminopeptidase [Halobacteriales archaeon]|jgi:Xaa-Pro aminopeptidase